MDEPVIAVEVVDRLTEAIQALLTAWNNAPRAIRMHYARTEYHRRCKARRRRARR